MSDCQSFQGKLQPISQNSNFGKITILRNALFQLKWVVLNLETTGNHSFHLKQRISQNSNFSKIAILRNRFNFEGEKMYYGNLPSC